MTAEPRVTYEQAKKLHEHGFNMPCTFFYNYNEDDPSYTEEFPHIGSLCDFNHLQEAYSAPTVSEALRFYRECKGVLCGVNITPTYNYGSIEYMDDEYCGAFIFSDMKYGDCVGYYKSYDDAASALLSKIQTLKFE